MPKRKIEDSDDDVPVFGPEAEKIAVKLRIISHVYHTQKGSGEVLFNPHGPVLYGPAKRCVYTLKRIATAHSSTLDISLSQLRPSPGFITPVPWSSASGEFVAGLDTAVRSNRQCSESGLPAVRRRIV